MLKFNFSVGETETHEIEFKFNQFWGNLCILVDGKKILSDQRIVSGSLTKTYEFNIGTNEKHDIKIEKTRKLLFAGFRENIGNVYIDGNFLYEFKGSLSLDDVFLKWLIHMLTLSETSNEIGYDDRIALNW